MKKRLLKAMPHVLLLELRPLLSDQQEVNDDHETMENHDAVNGEGNDEVNVNDNAIGQADLDEDIRKPVVSRQLLHTQIKRMIFRMKAYGKKERKRNVVANNENTILYGENESSESDGEGNCRDTIDTIPLVSRC